MTTPNMGLVLPVPNVTLGYGAAPAGQDWLSLENTAMGVIDAHAHLGAPSSGLQLTRPALPAVGMQQSSSCGTVSYSSTTPTAVTNLALASVSCVAGRPIVLVMFPAPGNTAQFYVNGTAGTAYLNFYRNSGAVLVGGMTYVYTGIPVYPLGTLFFLDTPGIGSYQYDIRASVLAAGPQLNLQNFVFAAWEM